MLFTFNLSSQDRQSASVYRSADPFELYNQLTLMRSGFEADYWVAPLLRYYEKYKTSELLRFLYLLDAKFSKEIETAADQNALFASPVFKVETHDLLRLLSGGIYGRRYGRYILLKIDLAYHGHTTKFSPPETISIEHILPQTPEAGSQWVSDFTEQDREKWTNRLGNLILLSRRKNTAQSNFDYLQKKEKYFKKNVELFSNSVRIFNTFNTWTLRDLQKNQKQTLAKLLALYGMTLNDDELNRAVE
ncbi:MAG: HNH endonuclease family protein [Thermoproteota archaeon]|nr:HNH endonuclease family protein [Thermoproteota archaeon]